jgi:exodeoxyribonuclease V alpha subunit
MSDEAPRLQWVRDALPADTPRLARLLEQAVERADLRACDVYSLADFLGAVDAFAAENLGLLLLTLMLALDEGSLAVEISQKALARRLADVAPDEDLASWIAASLADLDAGVFARLILPVAGDGRRLDSPLLLWQRDGRSFLYFQKYFLAERDFYRDLRRRLEAAPPTLDADRARLAVREVLEQAPLRSAGKPIQWDIDQHTALGLALVRNLVLISGGPGTGKTSIVLNILRALVRLGIAPDRIALAAPTGRAAQRLGDALRNGLASLADPCSPVDRELAEAKPATLHQLLKYDPSRNLFRRHEENPIPADVVLVDEVSMVSVDMMAALLRALPPRTRLLLLGDKDQLPSVEAGAVLGQLVRSLEQPSFSLATCDELRAIIPGLAELAPGPDHWTRDAVVFLRKNHRSRAGIRDVAAAVNRQDSSLLDRLPALPSPAELDAGVWKHTVSTQDCWWWNQSTESVAELCGMLHRWMEHAYLAPLPEGGTFLDLLRHDPSKSPAAQQRWHERLFSALDRTRILTLVRQGPWGCDQLNAYLLEWLRRRLGPGGGDRLIPGVPILITRNDRVRDIVNGAVGLCIRTPDGLRAVFPREGTYVSFVPESLPSRELGFALTVHKSQGSEYDDVLLLLPPSGGRRLLTKELLYTAITRAKRMLVLAGTPAAIRDAIRRSVIRDSGMTPGGENRGREEPS